MNTLLTSLLATATLLPLPHHRDLRTLSIGTERPRTMFMAWPDCSAGQSLRYEDSPWHQSLNGKWHFFYADDDHLLPHDATADQPDTQGWSTISVPGNWEMQGFGTAIYVNQPYEFVQGRPPTSRPSRRDSRGRLSAVLHRARCMGRKECVSAHRRSQIGRVRLSQRTTHWV